MVDCIFCKIGAGEIPSSKVFENNKLFVFLDISPANKGHTLIIPKEHYETLEDLPEDLAADMMKTAKKLSTAIVKATGCEGYNILMNNKPAAGQVVPHAHIHIIPKFQDDDFKLAWTHKKYDDGEIEEYAKKITQSL